jgi:parvulin-like peptidyl-prolyl isomerase
VNSFWKTSFLKWVLPGAGLLLLAAPMMAALPQDGAKTSGRQDGGSAGAKEEIADGYANIFPDVVAKVNGTPISGRELEREVRKELVPIGSPKWKDLRDDYKGKLVYSILMSLINSKLLYDEAVASGTKVSDSEVQDEYLKMTEQFKNEADLNAYLRSRGFGRNTAIQELHKSLLINKFLDEAIRRKVSITPEEMSKYYEAHPDEFKHPDIVRSSQIFIPSDGSPEADAKAKQQAQALLDRVVKGEDFAELARQYSKSASADRGGDLGFAAKDAMDPEYAEVAFSLPVGGAKLLRLSQGYFIVKVTDKKKEGKSTFEDAKDMLQEFLTGEKIQAEMRVMIDQLRDKSDIEILIPAGVTLE